MKRKILLVLAVCMSLILPSQMVFATDYPQRFWDVSSDFWAFEEIADLTERGVIKGYDDGSFRPNKTVSRAEWSKTMVGAAGLSANDNGQQVFSDMKGHWANKYVNSAKDYMTGYSDGTFRPNQAATREDVAVALVLVKGYDLSDVDYSFLSKFTDVDSISNYAKGYVAVATANNLISGFKDGTFKGQATLTRAEAATLLYRAFQHGNADKIIGDPALQNDNIEQSQSLDIGATNLPVNEENKNLNASEEIGKYQIETLSEINECNSNYWDVSFRTMFDDSIYYFEGTEPGQMELFKLNTITGNISTLVSKDATFEFKGDTYCKFKFGQVFTDLPKSRVLATGVAYLQSDFQANVKETVLLDVTNGEILNTSANTLDGQGYIFSYMSPVFYVDASDNFWFETESKRIATTTGCDDGDINFLTSINDYKDIYDCVEGDSGLYCIASNGVFNYDFSKVIPIVESSGISRIGGNENGFYANSVNDSLVHFDYSGEKNGEIKYSDIKITDKKPLAWNKVAYYFFINSQDEIIIYDIGSAAFRKISVIE